MVLNDMKMLLCTVESLKRHENGSNSIASKGSNSI